MFVLEEEIKCRRNRESNTSVGRGQNHTSNVLASTSVRWQKHFRSTVQKIIFHYYYKLQFVQELLSHDFRHLFSLQFFSRMALEYALDRRSSLSFDGSVNTHNCRIWERIPH
ncbi:hypothetical protein TNCV_3910961 [Trichonephila clavipes]|nr:hypothetical protein TNCV_3910961 [Trichonephila clavipes]